MPRLILKTYPGQFSKYVSLDPASIAAAAADATLTVTQTFSASTYPELTGLKANRPTFVQFRSTPTDTAIGISSAACYTNNVLSISFTNNSAGAVNLAAQYFNIWQL